MKDFFRSRSVELALTILMLPLCLLFFSLVSDDYSFFSFSTAARQYGDYPYFDTYYIGYVAINRIYVFIYNCFPDHNWLGISLVAFEMLALYLLLRAIKTLCLRNTSSAYLIAAIQFLFALLFIENIISVSHTRSGLLFCGISLLHLAFAKDLRKRDIVLYSLLFILGMLIRPEGSIGMLILVSAGYLLYESNILHLVRRFLLPVLATVTMFTVFAIDWSHTNEFVKKVEPEIEYKMMDRRVIPISEMKTARDSVKYQAATSGMWFDTENLNPDYLRSLLKNGMNLSATHFKEVLAHVLSFYYHYPFIPLLFFVLVLWCLVKGQRKGVLQIVFFQALTFGLVYGVDFNGSIESNRHFLNFELISLLILLFYTASDPDISRAVIKNKVVVIGSALCLTYGIAVTIGHYKDDNNTEATRIAHMESAMNKIESLYAGRVVVITNEARYLLDRKFSIRNRNYTKNTYVMFDHFTYSLTPRYLQYLGTQCHCNASDPPAFFDWLSSEKALYIAQGWRLDLTEKYMKEIHDRKVVFISRANINELAGIPDAETKEFEIGTVSEENQ